MNPKQINIKNDSIFERDDDKYRHFEYKRVATSKIQEECLSFAFNTNSTILFVGQLNGRIKALGCNNQIKIIQKANSFHPIVVFLIWIKKSNSLISGHYDKIIIWNQLSPVQTFEPKNQDLKSMILNEAEDLLILGFSNGKIQFWKEGSKGWICSQILKTSVEATDLSFNSTQNKLVISGFSAEKYIVVIERQNDKNWAITQNIIFQDYSLKERIRFINDNTFAYHSLINYLEIYDNQKNKQLLESQGVQIKKPKHSIWHFPSQFIEERKILMVKHGKYINYFSKDTNGDFLLLKNWIKFGSSFFFGRLSDEGLYLVTWDGDDQNEMDKASYAIQIRKIKYFNE